MSILMKLPASKRCFRCRRVRKQDAFGRTRTGLLNSWCKPCHRDYDREYFQREKARYFRIAKRRQNEFRIFLAKAKHGQSCADCRHRFPYFLLEFDHVRGRKEFNLARTVLSMSRVQREINKCELVCINCHRRRTFVRKMKRGGGFIGKRVPRMASLIVRAYKRRSVCLDCEQRFPYFVLDFDHLRNKQIALSRLVFRGLSVATMRNELAKCDLVCAMCHKRRTVSRRVAAGDKVLLTLFRELGIGAVGTRLALG